MSMGILGCTSNMTHSTPTIFGTCVLLSILLVLSPPLTALSLPSLSSLLLLSYALFIFSLLSVSSPSSLSPFSLATAGPKVYASFAFPYQGNWKLFAQSKLYYPRPNGDMVVALFSVDVPILSSSALTQPSIVLLSVMLSLFVLLRGW